MTKETTAAPMDKTLSLQEKKEKKKTPMAEGIVVSPAYATTIYTLLRAQNTNFNDFESYFATAMSYLKDPESASLHLYIKDKLIHSCTIKLNDDNAPGDRDFNFRDYEGMEKKQKALIAPQVVAVEGEDMCFILIDNKRMLIYNTTIGDYKPTSSIDLPIETNKQMAIMPLYTKTPFSQPLKLGVWSIAGKDLGLANSTLTGDDAITEIMLLFSTLSSGVSRIVERFDPLTKLPTRVAMDEQLKAAVNLYNEGKIDDFSLILFDIDDFKDINDTYGHLTGDLVLKEVSQSVFYSCRKKRETKACETQSAFPDFLARWGGEEFMQLVLGGTDTALECAKRFMKIINSIAIDLAIGGVLKITCSFGVASIKGIFGNVKGQLDESLAIKELIKKADEELYRGKNNGKNCICADGMEEPIRLI